MLVIVVITPDAYPFLTLSDPTYCREDKEIVVFSLQCAA